MRGKKKKNREGNIKTSIASRTQKIIEKKVELNKTKINKTWLPLIRNLLF